jgi:peptide/nickel transport system permease protein
VIGTPTTELANDPGVFGRPKSRLLGNIRRDRAAQVGLVIVAAVVLLAVIGPVIAPYDPLDVTGAPLEGPSSQHLLGTDGIGRDLLSRVLVGARLSLGAAALASALVMMLGVVLGTISGYAGGIVDSVVMRTADVILAFPNLLLALAIAGLFDPSLLTVMLSLVSVWWVGYARIVRGLVLSIREQPFIEAARAGGAGSFRIVARHILPNVLPTIIVLLTLEVGVIILVISGLNFLGLGAQPPTPEWGAMLAEGRNYFFSDARIMIVPGVAISLAVFGFNLLGDGLRDALDPRAARRAQQ